MTRPRMQRTINVIETRGQFGQCTFGGRVMYYTDSGVKCESCGKLYGVWHNRNNQNKNVAKKIEEVYSEKIKELMHEYKIIKLGKKPTRVIPLDLDVTPNQILKYTTSHGEDVVMYDGPNDIFYRFPDPGFVIPIVLTEAEKTLVRRAVKIKSDYIK